MVIIGFKEKTRVVEYFFPHKVQAKDVLFYCRSRVPFTQGITTVYETIETYEKIFFPHIHTSIIKISPKRISLRALINIHNDDGIKDISQIIDLTKKIEKGENILKSSGFPIIKLARLKSEVLLVFDGHHSLLAYLASGKTFLDQIPHIIVSGDKGILKNEEILFFWGSHAPEISEKNWKFYVINWQKPEKKQIVPRKQHNMGELFDALKERISVYNPKKTNSR